MKGVAGLCILSSIIVSGCTPNGTEAKMSETEGAPVVGHVRHCDKVSNMSILAGFKSHECVVRATVIEVGKPPGFWSGVFEAYQDVRYEVKEIFKGEGVLGNRNTILVHHVLVGNGAVEDTIPRLRPDLITPGREVVLFLYDESSDTEGMYLCAYGDDPLGVLFPHDDGSLQSE